MAPRSTPRRPWEILLAIGNATRTRVDPVPIARARQELPDVDDRSWSDHIAILVSQGYLRPYREHVFLTTEGFLRIQRFRADQQRRRREALMQVPVEESLQRVRRLNRQSPNPDTTRLLAELDRLRKENQRLRRQQRLEN